MAGEDQEQFSSMTGDQDQVSERHDASVPSMIDRSALSIEAEVENALVALRNIRAGKNSLQLALYEEQEQNRELRRVVEELTTYKDQAKRELTAAARMLTAEQERTTFLERSVKSADLRAKSLEEWNTKLRSHLDALIESIKEDEQAVNERTIRRVSA